MLSNMALPPLIIFVGVFGKTLMNKYKIKNKKSTVLFTKIIRWQLQQICYILNNYLTSI